MTRLPLTAADECYRHQDVAPVLNTAHVDPAWAERCWHLLNVGDGWVLGAGRATWPHGARRTAVAGLNTGTVQLARRAQEPFAHGEDPDAPQVGPIRIEAIRPLREVRLVLDDPELEFAFDLTYESRFPPVATDRNTIERDGQIVTDYMNFFQPGLYTGWVRADGEERRVERRAGFRDRGWGLRKHEGAARRGMHIFASCELPDESLYMLIYETASGRRVFTNGWVIRADGVADTVAQMEHDALRRTPLLTCGRSGDARVTLGRKADDGGRRRGTDVDGGGRLHDGARSWRPWRRPARPDRPGDLRGYQGLFGYRPGHVC